MPEIIEETIAAQATAPGQGGIGIIRIAGPESVNIAKKLTKKSQLTARTAVFSKFYDSAAQILDEGLTLYFPAPNSFTGDDVVECQTHGSPIVIDLLLKTITAYGARLARPGEFSERAFHNGKIDLAQAEAIADLIESSSETAARMATRSLQGAFSEYIHELVEQLTRLRIYVEASIDFPEEEIDFLSDGKIAKDLKQIIELFDSVVDKTKQGSLIKDGMVLVIAGQPNAGKSSLLNALSGRDSAIVTNIPGTTRDVLKESIQIDGMPIHLIDTAGLRKSDDEVEQEGIRRAKEQIKKADHILWIYDGNDAHSDHPENDSDYLKFAKEHLPEDIPTTFVKNKIDQINETPMIDHETNHLSLSAKFDQGIDLLSEHLKKIMGYRGVEDGEFLARRRHVETLRLAGEHLKKANYALHELEAGELLAEELRLTQNTLSEITGEFTNDDLLGKIFSSFCIGK